ncbi:MAG: DUF4824 family protein [Bryobacteraceae bacterium]
MRNPLLLAAAAVVVLTNAAIGVHVYRNRSAVTSELWLTERELRYFPARDDSGEANLLLLFAGDDYENSGYPWLDERKMAELGFDVRPKRAERRWNEPARVAYVAFELGGAARDQWQQERFQQMEERQKLQIPVPRPANRRQVEQASALAPVGAARDAGQLAARYGDLGRYLIARCEIRWQYAYGRQPATISHPQFGRIMSILPSRLEIPDEYRAQFQKLGQMPSPSYLHSDAAEPPQPRYRVRVRWGAHHEPWVVGIEMTP